MWPQCQSQLAHILWLSLSKSLQNWMCSPNQVTFHKGLHMTEPEKSENNICEKRGGRHEKSVGLKVTLK